MPRRATPDPLAKRIGARIRTLRKEAGLTLEKLAYESDVGSKGFLSDVEAGLARPTVETLSTIAERLEVDLLDLVTFAELAEVMADERAEDLFIGGVVDADDKALVLYRGNLNPLVVPFQWFKPRPKARPDFAAFAITDYGQTVQLGEYEVAADAILYEFDADARRRIKEREIKQDSSFGGPPSTWRAYAKTGHDETPKTASSTPGIRCTSTSRRLAPPARKSSRRSWPSI